MKNSVIMATYNGEKYITEQLDSIRNQTLPPDEVIICDDCSSDNTRTIINEYISKYKLSGWQLYSNEKNIGFFDNFFKALRLSTGDVIYLSDQDDVWDIDKIKKFTEYYDTSQKLMMIQSSYKLINSNGEKLKDEEAYHYFKDGNTCKLTTLDMCKFAGSGFTMSFRADVAKIIIENNIDKCELFQFHDILIGLLSAALGDCILDRNIIDLHRIHDCNVTKKKNKSFVSGRTKQIQLQILNSRIKYFEYIAQYSIDENKKNIFYKYSLFCKLRMNYIQVFNFGRLVRLIKNIKLYASKKGLVSDTLYSLGLEKLILLFIK